MKAIIRRYSSPDVDLNKFSPAAPEDVQFLLEVFVGPRDGAGEERFSFHVLSLPALAVLLREQGVVVGANKLLVAEYDWLAVKRAVERIVERASGETWDEVATAIGRVALWEFAK